MTDCCVRALVTGKVQGVSYRRATQEKALQQSLTGYAKNLPDGRVEVLMCGHSDSVKVLSEWLWQGPEGRKSPTSNLRSWMIATPLAILQLTRACLDPSAIT